MTKLNTNRPKPYEVQEFTFCGNTRWRIINPNTTQVVSLNGIDVWAYYDEVCSACVRLNRYRSIC